MWYNDTNNTGREEIPMAVPIKPLTIRLPKALWEQGSSHKISTGEPLSRLVVRLLEEYLKDNGTK